jgi:hypothetical protein
MTARPFDARSSSQPSSALRQDAPDGPPHEGACKEQAVAEILRHKVLSHTFGTDGEYEVRTTLVTRPTWQYRCCVLRHGKAITRAFVPILMDRTPPTQHLHPEPEGADAMQRDFAREAVDVHFTRCAALRDYLMMAAIYSQPPLPSRRWYVPLALVIGAAFLTTYGFWKPALWTHGGQPPGSRPPTVREAPHPVGDGRPTGPPASDPVPAFSGAASRDILASPVRQGPTPKAVRLIDLLTLDDPPERADHAARTPTPRVSPGPMASDMHAGDLLLLMGWIHRASRDPDSTYRLQVSPSREAGTPSLIAVVPHPDQASGTPAVRAQLQTVRAFITQRLLRQQEPSPRGSIMRHPIFVQLTGQLSDPDAPHGEALQGKGPRGATARWEVRPVLDIRFAPPPMPSDRSRLQ